MFPIALESIPVDKTNTIIGCYQVNQEGHGWQQPIPNG